MTVFPVGTHCILELHGCPFDLLNDESFIRGAVRRASEQGMSNLLQLTSHQFRPFGVTALALLAESHISVHTWPEHGYAAVDLFTCGETARPRQACDYLIERFCSQDHELKVLARGARVAATPAFAGQWDEEALGNEEALGDEEARLCQVPG